MAESSGRNSGRKAYFVAGVWLVWAVIATLSYARHYFEDSHAGWPRGAWPDILDWFACFFPWALFTPAIFWFEERFALKSPKWMQRLGMLLVAGLVFGYAGLQLGAVIRLGVDRSFGRPVTLANLSWSVCRVELFWEQFFFWSTFAAGWALRTFAQYHRRAREATQLALEKAQLEASLQRAELENLRMRLNPHFLFNTLQNISVLTQQNPKVASQMLTRLGDLLRVALRRDVQAETTLEDELSLTKDYLAVEKMRLGDRLTVLEDVEAGTERALIPSFLLQPLVENAVIHGLRGASQAGTIVMQARREGHRIVLTVADNGRGLPENWCDGLKAGVGLSSTQDRLARMYLGEHDFQIRKLAEGGTEVRIVIPYRQKEECEESLLDEQPSAIGG
jgi:two-component system, LytTR family, sensor kinase